MMRSTIHAISLALIVAFIGSVAVEAQAQSGQPAQERLRTGVAAIAEANRLPTPLGVEAIRFFDVIRDKSFEEMVKFSSKWIMDHIRFYDAANDFYKKYTSEMMLGGGPEGGQGMRAWLTAKMKPSGIRPSVETWVKKGTLG